MGLRPIYFLPTNYRKLNGKPLFPQKIRFKRPSPTASPKLQAPFGLKESTFIPRSRFWLSSAALLNVAAKPLVYALVMPVVEL